MLMNTSELAPIHGKNSLGRLFHQIHSAVAQPSRRSGRRLKLRGIFPLRRQIREEAGFKSSDLGEVQFVSSCVDYPESTGRLSAHFSNSGSTKAMIAKQDLLVHVSFISSRSILKLEFEDGEKFSISVSRLGMPVDRIKWSTAEVSDGGASMLVMGIKGDPVPVDSSTLRYLVDTKYAAEMDRKLESLQFTDAELERIVRDNPASPEWYAQPSKDMRRESWK
jgi:hypothetical protein